MGTLMVGWVVVFRGQSVKETRRIVQANQAFCGAINAALEPSHLVKDVMLRASVLLATHGA